jgi:hypothetical protein
MSTEDQLALLNMFLDLSDDDTPAYADFGIDGFDSLLYLEDRDLQSIFPSAKNGGKPSVNLPFRKISLIRHYVAMGGVIERNMLMLDIARFVLATVEKYFLGRCGHGGLRNVKNKHAISRVGNIATRVGSKFLGQMTYRIHFECFLPFHLREDPLPKLFTDAL